MKEYKKPLLELILLRKDVVLASVPGNITQWMEDDGEEVDWI